MQIVVAMTGATGAIYFVRTVRALARAGHGLDLVVSRYGALTLKEETDYGDYQGGLIDYFEQKFAGEWEKGKIAVHHYQDQTSALASGSAVRDAMVIVPCTMKTIAGVAHGFSTNLIDRAADVMLKERRPLVVVPREAPYNVIHLRNLLSLAEQGVSVIPASPAFYQHPKTFDDLGDFIAGRVLSVLGISHDLFPKWQGKESLGQREPE